MDTIIIKIMEKCFVRDSPKSYIVEENKFFRYYMVE